MVPTVEERSEAIAAIRAEHPEAKVPPDAESWVSDELGRRIIYLNAVRREGLTAGTPYGTWAVVFVQGAAVEVTRVDSLACAIPKKVDTML
ncbi:MAG: hypothetical protein ACI9KE_006625 [Polyangiales bacterium]